MLTNTEEIKQDISIVKLNISKIHKAIIPHLSLETLKIHSVILNENRSLSNSLCQNTPKLTFEIHPIPLKAIYRNNEKFCTLVETETNCT